MEYITIENLSKKLNREETKAFILFLICEERRHEEYIRNIRKTIKIAREHFDIEGLELAALYSQAGK